MTEGQAFREIAQVLSGQVTMEGGQLPAEVINSLPCPIRDTHRPSVVNTKSMGQTIPAVQVKLVLEEQLPSGQRIGRSSGQGDVITHSFVLSRQTPFSQRTCPGGQKGVEGQ